MTARKPPGMTFQGWIERQISAAEAEGSFENLPGQGKPLKDLNGPQHEMTWVANYLRRENVDVSTLLPPALALAKEVETLPDRLGRIKSEPEARRVIEDLNRRIAHAHSLPADGPPMRVKLVNVEAALNDWREHRKSALLPPQPLAAAAPSTRPQRRSWLRRRRSAAEDQQLPE